MLEEIQQFVLGRRPAETGMKGLRRRLGGGGEPFVADDHHRLGQVQRRKAGVERHRQHRVGQGQIVVQQPGALRPEQDAAGLVGGDIAAHLARRLARRHLAPDHAAVARGRGIDMDEIGDRRRDRRVEPRLVEHRVGAARRGDRPRRRPAVARPHQPQIVERAVHHRPRRGADILAELRLDQDDRRPARRYLTTVVGPGHGYSRAELPSPPSRGEREGPVAERWEGEVGAGNRSGIPTSPRPSPPPRAERE